MTSAKHTDPGIDRVRRSCPICEASCGLSIEVDRSAGSVLSIRGDEEDPRSLGYICPKAYALKGVYEDPDRIRRPLRRTRGGWEELAWDDALELVGTPSALSASGTGRTASEPTSATPSEPA